MHIVFLLHLGNLNWNKGHEKKINISMPHLVIYYISNYEISIGANVDVTL